MGDGKIVTLEVVKTLLHTQAEAFNSSVKLIIQDVKEELKSIRSEVCDLKVSLQFMQSKFDVNEKKLADIELTVNRQSDSLFALNGHADTAEGQLESL